MLFRKTKTPDNLSLLPFVCLEPMGNKNCIASGATPHSCDITIHNKTKFPLTLDKRERCGQECNHGGFRIQEGKISDANPPPDR